MNVSWVTDQLLTIFKILFIYFLRKIEPGLTSEALTRLSSKFKEQPKIFCATNFIFPVKVFFQRASVQILLIKLSLLLCV